MSRVSWRLQAPRVQAASLPGIQIATGLPTPAGFAKPPGA
jgi:hypothetical protein